jgi:hypothetical protein
MLRSATEKKNLKREHINGLQYHKLYIIRDSNQNVPNWCRHLYSSSGSAKHHSQKATNCEFRVLLRRFSGDCVKTCEDVATNFGSFTITTPSLTLPSSPSSFWRGAWRSEIATHHVTKHNTSIHNILSTAPQLSISQKAQGTLPEDGNLMPKHVGATIYN